MLSLILLILGAIAGVAVDRGYDAFTSRYTLARRRALERRHSEAVTSDSVAAWLRKYYDPKELHKCSISGKTKLIATHVRPEWIFCESLEQLGNRLVLTSGPARKFEIDTKLIDRRVAQGQRLFNNSTFYVHGYGMNNNAGQLSIAETEYFNVITNLIRLEDELFASLQQKKGRTPFRDSKFKTGDDVISTRIAPLSFGVTVAFVLNVGGKKRLLIHERSRRTVTHGNAKALFPCFGLSPIGKSGYLSTSQLVFYNLVKEYLEEFFDYEELIDTLSQNRLDPLWFLQLPEAIKLEASRKKRLLQIYSLGYSMDWLSGTTSLSILVELSDEELAKEIEKNIVGNWEVESPSLSGGTIELVDVYSPSLGDLLLQNALHGGSSYTIQRVQDFYSGLGVPPQTCAPADCL